MLTRSVALRLAGLAVVWGTSFLFIKVALEGLSPFQVVLGRLLGGAVALGAIVAVRREALPRERGVWGHLLAMAVVANIVPFALFAWAEHHGVPSGMAGVFNGSTPLFTLLIAVAVLPDERLYAARTVGFVLGFAGVVATLAPWRTDGGAGPLPAQLACVGAAACYGVAFNWTRRHLTGRASALSLAACQIGVATALALLLTPVFGGGRPDLTVPVVLATASLGVLGTGVAYLVYYGLIRDAGATTASLVTYLVPVLSVALGVAVAGEALTWNLPAGAALVILGVAVAEGRLRPRAGRRSSGAGGDGDPGVVTASAEAPVAGAAAERSPTDPPR